MLTASSSSTGGTGRLLREAGLKMIDVADITQIPEMMDGRVKTLHPKIYGGLLAVRGKDTHERALKDHAIPKIDLLAVNLYPFESTAGGGADFAACIEDIDIGGPALIRAGAEEPRERHRHRRSSRLLPRAHRDGGIWRSDFARFSQRPRGQGLCPHRCV